MLDQSTRTAILRLREQGHGSRAIAKALGVARSTVQRVVRDGQDRVPPLERDLKAEPYRDQVLALHASCKGNLVRVHEELVAAGAQLSYPALTAFCRRHGIGQSPRPPAGHYDFAPGEEMQHDTSPHPASVGGRTVTVQTASLVLCFSRMLFAQCYARFSRFECKVFLTDALRYFGGVGARVMIDNTHVVVLSGAGADMVPVPEMAAFAERFGFTFVAHEPGDADRSARVERPFDFIENNFFAGRRFTDMADLNEQLRAWCDKVNARHRRHLHASPRELFAVEQPRLRPLPIWVPEVYALHPRIVDPEGYVNVRRNRYSAPWQLIGRSVEARETKDRIEIYDGPRRVAEHGKLLEPLEVRVTDPAHRPPREAGVFARRTVSREEERVRQRMPEAADYVTLLRKHGKGTLALRRLGRLIDEYPREAVAGALAQAIRYGMADLERLERMVLRAIARDFFVLPTNPSPGPHNPGDDHDR